MEGRCVKGKLIYVELGGKTLGEVPLRCEYDAGHNGDCHMVPYEAQKGDRAVPTGAPRVASNALVEEAISRWGGS